MNHLFALLSLDVYLFIFYLFYVYFLSLENYFISMSEQINLNNSAAHNRELLSIKKASQLLGFSPSYISHLIEFGHLDYVLPPGHSHKKISRKAIQDFINNNTFNNSQDYYEGKSIHSLIKNK